MELAESYGRAINASMLGMREGEERAVDCLTASGWAMRAVESASPVRGRLASLLWKCKYGGDPKAVAPAIATLAEILLDCMERDPYRARPIAARALREWMHDRCPACAGTTMQEIAQGKRQRPQRHGAPGTRYVPCIVCEATGVARARNDKRAASIGMPLAMYQRDGWSQEFDLALSEVRTIAQSFNNPLHKRLRGRTIRPQHVAAQS